VALLRSALYIALQSKGREGLRHRNLYRSVFEAMQLRFDEYAADSGIHGPARDATNDALRRILDSWTCTGFGTGEPWSIGAGPINLGMSVTARKQPLTGSMISVCLRLHFCGCHK